MVEFAALSKRRGGIVTHWGYHFYIKKYLFCSSKDIFILNHITTMTNEEFINLVKTCKDRKELLLKLGGHKNTSENRRKYIAPLRREAGLDPRQLTELFLK
jgi:site-specific DNA-adenine methylase